MHALYSGGLTYHTVLVLQGKHHRIYGKTLTKSDYRILARSIGLIIQSVIHPVHGLANVENGI